MVLIYEGEEKYLSKLIDLKREEMLKIAKKFGMNNQKTLECSQELDKLIIKYQKML
ncbi:aspartyl-phosphate phosphatase Spo0E family protein [Halobacillus seohaensis]|uniref:Aspartyl-phosphate phosphatase Spo0E family protein n=1 Tax=Halobacillus seohaensis TaxID=447421 RepID=A0ABW2ER83_9BACI